MKSIFYPTKALRTAAIVALIAAFTATTLYAKNDKEEKSNLPVMIKTIPCESTPDKIVTNQCGIYKYTGNRMSNCNDIEMATFGKKILDANFNPSGYNYILLAAENKKNKARVYDAKRQNHATNKFNNKKTGEPTAVLFTPEGRRLLLAADKKINVLDAVKFTPSDTIYIDIAPTALAVSPNGNYLAISDGNNVTVLNFETKKPRFTEKIDGKVTGIDFNEDSSVFAILTADGLVRLYDTRTFAIKDTYEDFDGGIAMDFNFDGKYLAVATSPSTIEVVNLLDKADRDKIIVKDGSLNDMKFVPDSEGNSVLVYTSDKAIIVNRMPQLSPYYGKLIRGEADAMLEQWLKMMPGETMEQYRARVTEANRLKQLRDYENEVATRYANDLLSMASVSLGAYNRGEQTLQINFSNMPSIYLQVPEDDLNTIKDVKDLEFRNAVYGVMDNDHFELIYAEVYNKATGKTYIYNNLDRVNLSYLGAEDSVVSLEVLQQQQMEEMRLQELRKQVVEEAKHHNEISDHTRISVDSRVYSDYDADGKRIINYELKFTYEVDPDYTLQEDFGPGKYLVEESGAASAMLRIVKKAFETDLAEYLKEGKKLRISMTGTADGTPIHRVIPYSGVYGSFEGEPVRKDGQLTNITVTPQTGITENEQLAFVRGLGVKDFIEKNISGIDKMNKEYNYNIEVSQDKGSQFRRIIAEFLFVDAF